MNSKLHVKELRVLLESHFSSIKSHFRRPAPSVHTATQHSGRQPLSAGGPADRTMLGNRSSAGDVDCLKEFAAAYEALKARHEAELANLKHDIRRMHKNVRTEMLTGDPQKAAELSRSAIEWMNGINVLFQETKQRPIIDPLDQGPIQC